MTQPAVFHNLPPQLTPFIGRADEVARISGLLVAPACRLLTLAGAGGVGKTRLALQVAAGLQARFAHGVYFVSLQPVDSMEFLAPAIADALNFALSGQAQPRLQLLDYLSDKDMLLVLDNFEQLLPEGGAEFLLDILKAAPAVRLLVTSREVLNLREEQLYPVQGMPFPSSAYRGDIEAYSAVVLFVERAWRVRPDFSPRDEQAGLIRICQLVEGVPLAIELAAAWTKTLRCAAIAAEIQRNLDFLSTSLRDVPERHRSMLAVFNQTWQRLAAEERAVFQRLSVFRGGFRREAAEQVAGATLPILSLLLDKFLLRREAGGRYQVHELLRQYAEEQLRAAPEDVSRLRDQHCAYYTNFLHQRRAEMDGGRQREATAEIEAELENIRAAWLWAVEAGKIVEILRSVLPLKVFYHFTSRFLEAATAFEKAVLCLESKTPGREQGLALANTLVSQGWFCIRLGKFEQAQAVLERGRAIFEALGSPPEPEMGTDPLTPLAILANIRGDYAAAVELGELARRTSEARGDKQNLAFSYYVLTGAFLGQGQYETARRCGQLACATARAANNRWFMAYCLNEWGSVARAMGEYAEARQHYQASYTIREEFNDPEGMAVALNHLGEIALLQERYHEAQRLYEQSLAIYQNLTDQGGLAACLNGLGRTASALDQPHQARRYFHQALEITAAIRFLPLTFSLLINIGQLFLAAGRPERGLELLALTRQHPASDQEARERAGRLLDSYRAGLSPELVATAVERGQAADLETTLAVLETELAAGAVPAGDSISMERESPSLVEPLTPRELEVLRLIAAGRSNPEIADELVLTIGTVKWYASQLYGKLQVQNRTEAALRARELGLL